MAYSEELQFADGARSGSRGCPQISDDLIHIPRPRNLARPSSPCHHLLMQRPHSNGQVDRAGKILRETMSEGAYAILSSWRAFHAYPLDRAAATLKSRALLIDPNAIVAQRLKRFPSIQAKLQDKECMALTQMQDIAGCRAVVSSIDEVYKLKEKYLQYAEAWPDKGPELIKRATKDYIFTPKPDGYRSVHLVLKYRTKSQTAAQCNGLRVEVQIRSRMQHAWAMAVETASSLTNQALKSGRGRDDWKKFFRCMSSAIAIEENMPLVPFTPEDEGPLYATIRRLARELRVLALFQGMSHVVKDFKAGNLFASLAGSMYLLVFNAGKQNIEVAPFASHEFSRAIKSYAEEERRFADDPNVHVVLVSVDSLAQLGAAYPSYFLDTTQFVNLIEDCCDRGAGGRRLSWDEIQSGAVES